MTLLEAILISRQFMKQERVEDDNAPDVEELNALNMVLEELLKRLRTEMLEHPELAREYRWEGTR